MTDMQHDPPSRRRRLGVCSWSLQPTSPADLVSKVTQTGLSNVQLALDPIRLGDWDVQTTLKTFDESGLAIVSGMMTTRGEDYTTLESIRDSGGVRPDEHWESNKRNAIENAVIAQRLGVSLVTLHAGFLPHHPRDPERRKIMSRLRAIIDIFDSHNINVAFETGQETAEVLLDVLTQLNRPNAGVNFDPANMVLYGMGDPVTALSLLAPYVQQIHIKDAIATTCSGTWGTEVPVGKGDVAWEKFFEVIKAREIECDFMIEREAGSDRIEEIIAAKTLASSCMRSQC